MNRLQPYYADDAVTLYAGDCLDVLPTLPDCSVDAVVTDPPYGLEFMGKEWDKFGRNTGNGYQEKPRWGGDREGATNADDPRKRSAAPNFYTAGQPFQQWCQLWAAECLRILKPGGHLLAFGGTRTWHRLTVAIEDAGFEIRDSIAWLYGSGFPKSLDVSKAIDRQRTEDRAPVDAVRSWLNEQRARAGFSHDAVNKHFGHASNGGGSSSAWMTNPTSRSLPTWDQWLSLKALIGFGDDMDGEVWRLNGRKGQPGDAWDQREVIGSTVHARSGGEDYAKIPGSIAQPREADITAPATADAQRWQGWGTALKPAHEPVVCARKPFNAVPLGSEANRLHHLMGALLWLSLSSAKRAELTSLSSPAEHGEAWCASALASAATDTSPARSAETDTYSSPALASTFLSIVTSWNATLAALSDPTRTSTTSTRSSTTTALRTLNSLLGPLTSQTTMPACECLLSGQRPSAPNAAARSNAEWASWLSTLSDSVPATATEGIALVVASALADIAAELSSDPAAGSSAHPSATTNTATKTGSGTNARTADSRTAHEPVVVARKPLVGTVAANVLAHGTGALNIDGCRIEGGRVQTATGTAGGRTIGPTGLNNGRQYEHGTGREYREGGRWPANVTLDETAAAALDHMSGERPGASSNGGSGVNGYSGGWVGQEQAPGYDDSGGASRFFKVVREDEKWAGSEDTATPGVSSPQASPDGPSTNVEAAAIETSGSRLWAGPECSMCKGTGKDFTYSGEPMQPTRRDVATGWPCRACNGHGREPSPPVLGDMPARFMYTAKAGSDERITYTKPGAGNGRVTGLGGKVRQCNVCETRAIESGAGEPSCGHGDYRWAEPTANKADVVSHPTVKPLSLMRWLVRLVTPHPGGLVLDPFAGSGTTVEAALLEGFRCIAIEREADYLPLITQRLNRRRDPVAYLTTAGEDLGLFEEPA